jgi:hypothetical protein
LTARLGRALLIAGASLLLVGLVGRFALGGGGDDAGAPSPSPSISAAPTPEPTAPTGPTAGETTSPEPEPSETLAAETPEEFFADFAEAIRTGDVEFLLARLHPVVLERYGRQRCRAAVASLATDPTLDVKIRSTSEPGSYEFASDGKTATVEDAFTVALTFTTAEGTARQDGHVALVDGELRWFTDCGEPLA